MDAVELSKILSEKINDVRLNEKMAEYTSFKVGGPADIMVLPKNKDEIKHAVSVTEYYKFPLTVIGRGTNLIVTSKGIRGVVLRIGDNFSGVRIEGERVIAKSGTPLSALVREAIDHSLGGAECLGGIPGCLGGAVSMNAGAYGGEIGDFIEEVYVLAGKEERTLKKDDMEFGYRKSILAKFPYIVTGAMLKLFKCDPNESRNKLSEFNEKRREKQPLEYPSAGSTFKRPEGYFAGTLIEQAGLKGLSVGGAQVSEKHAGFVINKGGATPEDIFALIKEVQRRIKEYNGVTLETEVKIVGER